MKIIDIGICIDNVDPKGIGRIRCIDYDDYISGKENYRKYTPWSEEDPFIALPFLPNNINFVPENFQSVKVLRFNTEKTTVNQEYIAGPFTTRFDFNGQTYSEQITPTTFGSGIKDKINIFSDGKLPKDCENMLTKDVDYSISGKFGSDIVLTESGLVLRGGKLLSKQSATIEERKRLSDYPVSSKKVAKLQLKKFSDKKVLIEEEKVITTYQNVNLQYVIEYDVDSITNPTTIKFFIYKINTKVYGDLFKSNYFTEFTELPLSSFTLLNNDNSTTTPTFSINMLDKIDFSTSSLNKKIIEICSEIRTTIINIKDNGFIGLFSSDINKNFNNVNDFNNIYPFFFRPTSKLRTLSTSNSTELTTKNNLLLGVKLSKNIQQSGLVWSSISFSPPPIVKVEKTNNLKKDLTSREQTFGSITSDKIYFLSTDTNFTNKTIEFEKLNNYEYEQDDYLNKIDPNTYGVVRGEILLEFLKSMYGVLLNHIHNINEPYARISFSDHETMSQLYNKLENELLNKSIRIN
jgi:hypothetical protein